MNTNREEVMNKKNIFAGWHETKINTNNKGKTRIMADEKNSLENFFDISFEAPPEKGKACHMQVDEDLHRFLKMEHNKLDVTFRKLANELLCKGIQQYIKAKKLNIQIRNRTK
jgi:hypothetical protein